MDFTPESVPVDRRYTQFIAIDPGVTDLWSGVRMSLSFSEDEDEEEEPDLAVQRYVIYIYLSLRSMYC
jgi:hypothetical protein